MAGVVNRRSIMTLYAEASDPIGHSVRIVLAEKDIDAEVIFVTHESKPEELNDLNPYRGLLTLIDRDLVIYEPAIMMEYLDERYPHPPLMPVDPVSRANIRQIRYRVTRDLYGLIEKLHSENVEVRDAACRELRDDLLAITPIFSRHQYLLSDEYSLADCCLVPLLWRLNRYGVKLASQAKPLLKYAENLFNREAFKVSLSPAERDMHRLT
ncbi:MAG: stringent starvation protein A [Gammaproteobacteria bacterium]|nr:stringent starvation protein A [Gammaproteobacteria bacterium]